MIVNEVAQWACIVGLLLLTLGIYRQVGFMLIGSRGLAEGSFGPNVGDVAPERVIDLFQKDLAPDPARRRVLLMVRTDCPICEGLMEILENLMEREEGIDERLAIVVQGTDEYRYQVAARFPLLVVESFARVFRDVEPPRGYPFALQFDDEFHVTSKQVGDNVVPLLSLPTKVALPTRRTAAPFSDTHDHQPIGGKHDASRA